MSSNPKSLHNVYAKIKNPIRFNKERVQQDCSKLGLNKVLSPVRLQQLKTQQGLIKKESSKIPAN